MIPQETVELIKDTAQIVDVISDFVTLKRRGGNFVACCPFHNEKTPSFNVSPSRGIYKCFGCGKSGTAIGFIMEYEHLSYVEALRYLANKYHIEVKEEEETAEQIAARQRNESLLLVSDFAGKFFVDQLATPEGRSIGYQYFKSRGLEDETIAKYRLGWAPRSRKAFTEAAKAAGYKDEYLLETGLCAQYDGGDGSLHDRFYDRVIFPIHSVSGRVIAFGGRTLLTDKSVAKYVNSKESEIYVKSRSLYGIYYAKAEMSRRDKCYLVEGYLDVLSMHQLGITNVVASSGTSLTVEQIRLIKKFTENVTIMYDGDGAGIKAALRGIDMVLKEGMNVKVVLIPDGDDPDSYSRKHTLEEVEAFIAANERDFIGFKTDLLLEEAGGDPLKKANLINDIADTIAGIPDAVKRSVYVDETARKFSIGEDLLFDRIRRTRERMLEEARAERERERRREAHDARELAPPPGIEDAPAAPTALVRPVKPVSGLEALENDPILAPSERELLIFLLRYGREPLQFESDSEFFSPEPRTVAEFIDDAMAGDDIAFSNIAYRKVYDAYFRCYDAGLDGDATLRALLDDPDRDLAFVASEISEEKYQLTVDNFSRSMTVLSSWLVNYVPKSILAYQEKRIQKEGAALKDALTKAATAEEQLRILQSIQHVNAVRVMLQNRLGRDNNG